MRSCVRRKTPLSYRSSNSLSVSLAIAFPFSLHGRGVTSLQACLAHQFSDLASEGVRNPHQHIQSDVLLTALNPPHVVAMTSNSFRELFLREAQSSPTFLYGSAERSSMFGNALSLPHACKYTK